MLNEQEDTKKKLKTEKKKTKNILMGKTKSSNDEKYDVKREQVLEAATAALVKQMASTRSDLAVSNIFKSY